jgi:hypothetical protein
MAEYTDVDLNDLVFKAIVPKGLRPETPEETDALLDVVGGEKLPEDAIRRMLRKIRGEEPLGRPPQASGTYSQEAEAASLSDAELAHYRNRKGDIPPEVKQLLEDMEDEALQDGEDDGNESGSSDA